MYNSLILHRGAAYFCTMCKPFLASNVFVIIVLCVALLRTPWLQHQDKICICTQADIHASAQLMYPEVRRASTKLASANVLFHFDALTTAFVELLLLRLSSPLWLYFSVVLLFFHFLRDLVFVILNIHTKINCCNCANYLHLFSMQYSTWDLLQ